jgi:electron transfer flavoprotein beta subunit
MSYHICVCAGIVPDPLQTLEPIAGAAMPGLKNELMLPAGLDPWAAHALFEAAHLAAQTPDSKVWLVSLAPKSKLQQVMMTVAQKAPFELVPINGSASGFADAFAVAEALADGIAAIPGLDRGRLLVFGGWESASVPPVSRSKWWRAARITEQFQGADSMVSDRRCVRILERIEGRRHQVSVCVGPPAVIGWATGHLAEPPNNPQRGMANMRTVMPALQKAKTVAIPAAGTFDSVVVPSQRRNTRIVKDLSSDAIAEEIVKWIER